MDFYQGKDPKKLYIHKLRQSNKRRDSGSEDSPTSGPSGGSSDIVSPSALSSSIGSSPATEAPSSPAYYKKQILSPRVHHPAFSPATPDLMDIDLEELGEISDMTHSWPSPGPISPQTLMGKGKGKGSEDVDMPMGKDVGSKDVMDELLSKDLMGKGKCEKGRRGDDPPQANPPIHSSQRQPAKPTNRRGKNLAALAHLQTDDMDFSVKPMVQKEQDDMISSSDTKPSTSGRSDEVVQANSPGGPTLAKKSKLETPDKMRTIDTNILHEIQSTQRPGANKVLQEAGPNELEELAKSICKTTTDRELSAFVTRALDLSVVGDQRCMTSSAAQDAIMHVTSSSNAAGVLKGRRKSSCSTSVTSSVTSSRVSCKKEEPAHLCQVCGDIAAGFHCGAFVCEACKKFFVRCLKQENGEKFSCTRNKTCVITKETRTQCQACRFHRCVGLGMYKPGTGPISQMSQEICNIPCKVCGAPSSGYHFGAITCEGCKGFFRRTVKEREGLHYTCNKSSTCAITTATRNVCKACRYNKCLSVGMTQDGSRIGRQPNSIKHRTMLELASIRGKDPVPETSVSAAVHIKEELPDDYETPQCSNPMPAISPPSGGIKSLSPQYDLSPPIPNHHMAPHHHLPISQHSPPAVAAARAAYQSPPALVRTTHPAHIPHPLSYHSAISPQAIPNPAAFRPPPSSPGQQQPVYSQARQYVHRQESLGQHDYHPQTLHLPRMPEPQHHLPRTEPVQHQPHNQSVLKTEPSAQDNGGTERDPAEGSMPVPILNEEVFEMQRALILAHEELNVVVKRNSEVPFLTRESTKEDMWNNQMKQFFPCAHGVLKFAKKIPGFRKLDMEKQIMIVQMAMYPIVLVKLSTTYDLQNLKYNYFNFEKYEEDMILHMYPGFSSLLDHLHLVGQSVQRSKLDQFELSAVCALFMFTTGKVEAMENMISAALEAYLKSKFGSGSADRLRMIRERLTELDKCNMEHQQAVIRIKQENPDLEIPQLYQETFLDDDD